MNTKSIALTALNFGQLVGVFLQRDRTSPQLLKQGVDMTKSLSAQLAAPDFAALRAVSYHPRELLRCRAF